MAKPYTLEQSVQVEASVATVDHCITDQRLMHCWLNPALRCEPVGPWSTTMGSKSRFIIQIPILQPSLISTVVERQPGLIVWGFQGFFEGCDHWECCSQGQGTLLVNRFEFSVPNPLVNWGFKIFAAAWTRADMKAQLQRLKVLAEFLERQG